MISKPLFFKIFFPKRVPKRELLKSPIELVYLGVQGFNFTLCLQHHSP